MNQAKCASFEAIAISGDNETEVEDDESCCSDYESEDEQADISQPFSKAPVAATKPSDDAMWTLGKRNYRQTALNFGDEDDELMINQEKQNGGKRQRKAESKFNVQTGKNEKGLFQSRIARREPLIIDSIAQPAFVRNDAVIYMNINNICLRMWLLVTN